MICWKFISSILTPGCRTPIKYWWQNHSLFAGSNVQSFCIMLSRKLRLVKSKANSKFLVALWSIFDEAVQFSSSNIMFCSLRWQATFLVRSILCCILNNNGIISFLMRGPPDINPEKKSSVNGEIACWMLLDDCCWLFNSSLRCAFLDRMSAPQPMGSNNTRNGKTTILFNAKLELNMTNYHNICEAEISEECTPC